MATYTDTLGFDKGSAAYPADALNKCHRVEVVLDFPKIAAARLAAGATALAADILEVIPIPAGTIATHVGMQVLTASGATWTMSIGDVDTAAVYLAATSINATGFSGGIPVLAAGAFAPTQSGGKLYAAANALRVTLSAAPAAAVVRVFAVLTDVS